MQALPAFAWREEFLHGYSEHLRKEDEGSVVHIADAGFDFRESASRDVEAGDLKLGRECAL